MTKLLIVRHGYSTSNVHKTFTGHIDSPLSEIGFNQAEKLSAYINENYKVDEIYSSDLSRAFDTVMPLAKVLNKQIIKQENLREIYGGKWEGEKFDDLIEKYKEDYYLFRNNPGISRCTGGESYVEAGQRILTAVNEIAKNNLGKTVVIATHGGVIRALQCLLMKIPFEEMNKTTYVVNASVSVVEYKDGKLVWLRTDETAYLDGLVTQMPKI
jgi:broad specificity phosphatase PhoE